VTADRPDATPGTITNIRLPIGALLQNESISLFFKVSCVGTNPTIPAKYSSTFIKRMSITINNTTVQILPSYNFVYNCLTNHTNRSLSKSIIENIDPTITYTDSVGSSTDVAIVATQSILAANTNQTNIQMCINNFIGFFSADTSCQITPTALFGEIVLSVEWAPNYECLMGTAEATQPITYTAADTYTVSDIYLTAESVSFGSTDYYQYLDNRELQYAYPEYIVSTYADVSKVTGINITNYVSANCIDWVFATAIHPISTVQPCVGWGGLGTGASDAVVGNLRKYLSDPKTFANNNNATAATNIWGDGYYSSAGMKCALQHIESGVFSINNKMLNYGALNQTEMFNNNLCCLNYMNNNR
jgi:hypothetical protein